MNKVYIITSLGICGLIGFEWYATHVCMDSWNWALRGFTGTWVPIIYALVLVGYIWRKTEESEQNRKNKGNN